MEKYYITTPIYYVNDAPHIGHAYTSIISDVIARTMRMQKISTMFLTGTDEHGQKIEKTALHKGMSVQDYTTEISSIFRSMNSILNISNDYFIRTTDENHKNAVKHLWQKLEQNGYIYLGTYSGWYSIRDEAFFSEQELIDGKAPTGAPVEWVEEPCYFFALSKFQKPLLEFYKKNPNFVKPQSRYNEVLNLVESGMNDLCISRTSFSWGINVPNDNKHVIYVWLDALTNYISALGYPNTEGDFKKFWPANVHIVGKDILRFHAIYWPAFLMAANLELPYQILAHGWWTNEGEKISKSLGNTINPLELVEECGLDYVRYFLIREINLGSDGNYSKTALVQRSTELANKIGNLLQRTTSLLHQNNQGKIPNIKSLDELYNNLLITTAIKISQENITLIEQFNLNLPLENIINLSDQANLYIVKKEPWVLKNTNFEEMLEVLYVLLETLRYIGIMLLPFIPDSANKILDALSIPGNERLFEHLKSSYALKPEVILPKPNPIFIKLCI